MDDKLLVLLGSAGAVLTIVFNWRRDITNQLRSDYDRVFAERNTLQKQIETERAEHLRAIESVRTCADAAEARLVEQLDILKKRLAEKDEVIVNQSVRLAQSGENK